MKNPMQRLVGGLVALFAKAPTIGDLQQKLVELSASARAIQESADRDGRDLTPEEVEQVSGFFAAFDATEADIKRREQMDKLQARLNSSPGRQTDPEPLPRPAAAAAHALEVPAGTTISGGDFAGATRGSSGFRNLGEMARTVKNAVVNPANVDPRLKVLAAAPTTQSQEAVGADGGYLVPPDFRTYIMQKVMGEDSLLSKCDQQTTSSNSITIPVDETTPWQTTGGVQVYWEGEGQAIAQSKVALNNINVRANKVAALVPVTEELLEDSPSLTAYLNRKVPDKMTFKLNDAIVNGDGVGKPVGLMKSPALVTQAAEGAQAAGTVLFNNITKMWSRMYAPLRRNAVWITNQDIEPQLASMVIPAAAGVSSPAYLPPGSGLVANNLNGTLMGRPIVYTDATAAIGTPGDIILADLTQYLALVKTGGMKSDVSIHLWFDYHLTAFRFTLRVGGLPWWAAAVTRPGAKNTVSFAVALAAR